MFLTTEEARTFGLVKNIEEKLPVNMVKAA